MLARIKELVAKGHVRYTFHARMRMDERNASESDVCSALLSASAADYNAAKDNYRVSGGADQDGDPMTVVVSVEADVVVITIF
ncbi:MAG TPA: DUF4258 domain-containing protein [Kofleriaceae bacterium]|nr:DUF4258 domain-containing protein [Kofleriaceae bacterium]